ncbi:MAG TPA: hypothetical protein VGU20_08175 [Stellaceae bacterium]|nr:hypothetical protein [Stellaceae bacterium]
MMKLLRRTSIIAWLTMLGGTAGAQTPATVTAAAKPSPITEIARWQVFYRDDQLGIVVGDARVDWKGERARVEFPYGGQTNRLEARSMRGPSADNEGAQFLFDGAGAASASTPRPDTGNASQIKGWGDLQVNGSSAKAEVKVAHGTARFDFDHPDSIDRGSVRVELAAIDDPRASGGDPIMLGRWDYAADPLTLRDAAGGGRIAQFTMESNDRFGGRQSGSELWLPLRPEIEFVTVLDEQLESPHPRAHAENSADSAYTRYLFVLGRNLPMMQSTSASLGVVSDNIGAFKSADADLDSNAYALVGTPGDNLTGVDRARIHRGQLAATREIKDEAQRQAVLSLESALIKVRLSADFVPGIREFSWAGAKIRWRLATRDARAEVRFVREVGATEWEAMPEGYLPEKAAVEVRTPVPIAFPSFKVVVRPFLIGPDGEAHAIGPEQEWVAERTEPQVYRTAPHLLSRKGGGGIEMEPGAVLIAYATPSEGLLSAPASAQLTVTSSAGQQTDTVDVPDPDHPGNTKKAEVVRTVMIWPEYILAAARTQDRETTDLRNLATKKETQFKETLVFALSRVKTDIYYGDHAAMLLLRDTFIGMMERADVALADAVRTSDGALGYARIARAVIRADPNSALAGLDAGTLNGRSVTLAEATDPALVRSDFNDDQQSRDDWLVGATRTAVTGYRDKLKKSLTAAKEIGDGDIEKLLRLTGNAFAPVVARALPRLMRLDDSAQWVPDTVARGYVRGVADKFKELRAYQEAAKIDNELILGVAAAVVALPTVFSHSALAYAITAVGEGAMFEVRSAGAIHEEYKTKDEMAFAFGASPVLGDKRFAEATLADPGWAKTLILIGVDAALTGWSTLGNLRKLDAALMAESGARLVENSVQSIYQLAKLGEREQQNLLAFLAQARSLRSQGATLSRTQGTALKAFDQLGELAAKDAAAGAKVIATARRLRDAEMAIVAIFEKSLAEKAAKEVVESQRLRREMIADVWRAAESDPKALLNLSEFELGWMSGAITKADEARALAVASAHDFDWHALKSAFQDGKVSGAEMHNFVSYREDLMKKLLDESIEEVKRAVALETGVEPKLIKKALGSTNLTSDLDYSAFGEGAERVVKVFNEKFRGLSQFKGLESGHVFDTNVYTQAVYELYRRKVLVGTSLGIANADLDALRQLMYERMATRKYIGSVAAWQKNKAALLAAATDDATRKMFADAMEEAEYSYDAAQSAIAKRLGVTGEEALHAAQGSNALLKATNQEYERLLGDIGQWRTERTRLQQLMTASPSRLPDAPVEFLERYPGWRNGLLELLKLKGVAGKESEFKALAETWADRLAYQLRKKQGEALFYASEAYQDEGTILHVVTDLQEAKRGKEITLAKLQGGPVSKVLDKMDGRGALNSMMENLANLRKELGHADDAAHAAPKGGKYFIRVLDSGHEGGLDVIKILGEDLVKQTIGVDASRASLEKVGAFLKESKTTPEAFVKALESADERLGVEMVKHKDITSLAGRLGKLFDEVPGAAEATQKSAAIGAVAR